MTEPTAEPTGEPVEVAEESSKNGASEPVEVAEESTSSATSDQVEIAADDITIVADGSADATHSEDLEQQDDSSPPLDSVTNEVEPSDSASTDSDSTDSAASDGDSTDGELSDRAGAEPSEAMLLEAKRAIEAIILVTTDPISSQLLAQLLELPTTVINNLVAELAGEYDADHRGFELVGVAGGWRFQTRSDLYQYVERFALEGFSNKLSKAALETLSIVAYKQPISRSQITAIRGVNADGVLKTLEQRGYVEETGRDDGPGQAMLFGTTTFFLERLGINDLEDLPPLGDFVPSAEVLEILEESLRIDSEPEASDTEDESTDSSEEE